MLGLKCAVTTSLTGVDLCGLQVNVIENHHPVRTTTTLAGSEFPIAHLGIKLDREARDVLSLRDAGYLGAPLPLQGAIRYRPNAPDDPHDYAQLENVHSFTHSSRNLWVTNQFSEWGEPLFWRHNLDIASVTQDVSVVDETGRGVGPQRYKVILEVDPDDANYSILRAVLAHNLAHDIEKGRVYFVLYKDAAGISKRAILDQAPLFKKATGSEVNAAYSLNTNGELLIYWSQLTGATFQFTLPADHSRLAWKYTPSHFLQIRMREGSLPDEPWVPVVDNFEWVLYDGSQLRLPEWYDQNFFPTQPTRIAKGDTGIILNDLNLMQFSNRGMLSSLAALGVTYYIEVFLYEPDGAKPVTALTNDPGKKGQAVAQYPGLAWTYDSQMSVVYQTSHVYTSHKLDRYTTAVANYPYESQSVEISLFDLNPFRDASLLGKRIIYYLVPYQSSYTRVVEALVLDADDMIESVTQDGSAGSASMSSWVGKPYRYNPPTVETPARITSGALPLHVFLGSDWYTENVVNGDIVLLGEFAIPEHLLPGDGIRITDVRRVVTRPHDETAKHNLFAYHQRVSINRDVLACPALITGTQIRMHWAALKDYNDNELLTRAEIEKRLTALMPADTTWSLCLQGIPWLAIQKVSMDTAPIYTVTLRWQPVERHDRDVAVGGVLYRGTSQTAVSSQVTSFSDLSVDQTTSVSIMSGERYWYKIRPFVTIDGVTHWGPDSNIIAISL